MHYIKWITSQDGTALYTKIDTPPHFLDRDTTEQVNVIIVHGLAEHLDRYDALTAHLNAAEFNVIRYDQRGHGRSEGPRGHYEHKDQIIEDLAAVVDTVKSQFNGRIFLIGHSMGGYTVSLFGTRFPGRVDGIITSGAVTRDYYQFFNYDDSADLPPAETPVPNEFSEGLCSDAEVVEAYHRDDLILKSFTMGLIYAIVAGLEELKTHASQFTEDVLIMHGEADGFVHPQDAIQFHNEIGSEHKSLRLYDGLEHEIFNESGANDLIFLDIVRWIEGVVQRKNSTDNRSGN